MKEQNKVIRILHIDDDIDDQQFFQHALSHINDYVICEYVSNGEDGLKKLVTSETLPDYIFLDLNMPKMNGMQVLGKIKESEITSQIPVIICSTATYPPEELKAKNHGPISFISKPTRIADMINIIRRVLYDK